MSAVRSRHRPAADGSPFPAPGGGIRSHTLRAVRRHGSRLPRSAIQISIAIVLLGWTLSIFDWRALGAGVARISPTTLVIAATLFAVTHLCLSVRWYLMIRRAVPGSLVWHVRVYCRATVFNLVTPAAAGADLYCLAVLGSARGTSVRIAGLLVRERLVGLLGYSMFYLACLGTAATRTETTLPPFFIGMAGTASIGAAVVTAPYVAPRLLGFAATSVPEAWARRLRILAESLRGSGPGEFVAILVLTVVACLTWTASAKVFADDVGVAVSLPLLGMIAVVAEVVRLIPLSVQGLGVREGVYAFGAGLLDQSREAGFLAGGLVYLVHSLVLAVAGAVAALSWSSPREWATAESGDTR